ncbi:hypothetical protein CHUAL_007623 [Chamberlinius hualienensis]|uniref:Cytochrome P450 3200C3 n=1 Tax=Chamberlinius hualienensis TaxID=1551368 RepID=A0A1J1DVR3_9MYRI|nr:cytochrome P450 3200C3 [Chamberlinius hualienensis]
MAVDFIWLWSLLVLLLPIAYWYLSRPKNLPPGTAGLPIVGYMPFISEYQHETFKKLGQKYGNLFHLYLGSLLVIVLNDYSSIYDALVKNGDIFSGRPQQMILKETSERNLGLASNDGEYWKQHRRFIRSNLTNFGFGKGAFEPLILEEIHQFLKELRQNVGKSFNIRQLLMNTVSNNVNIMITGKRLDYDDPVLIRFNQIVKQSEGRVPSFSLASFFPWISKFPGANKIFKSENVRKHWGATIDVATSLVNPAINEYEDGLNDNYIHAYLSERNARVKANGDDDVFTESAVVHITRDLFLAGTSTTAFTVLFSLLYMTRYPEIQKTVQNEIDSVVGRERQPSYNDRSNMPYTEATILEIHRKISHVPLSLPHRNIKDVQIQGYVIPKDTMIIPNLWAVHNDPNIWGDPETFRPERFIGSDGKLVKTEYVIPFSLGKRACVGEPLARMEIFLYFVSLLQQFTFIPPEGEKLTLETFPGFSLRPKFQNVHAILRQ